MSNFFNLTSIDTTGGATSASWNSENLNSWTLTVNNQSASNATNVNNKVEHPTVFFWPDDEIQYNLAWTYLRQIPEVVEMMSELEEAEEIFRVELIIYENDDNRVRYDSETKTIYIDLRSALLLNYLGEYMSPAMTILHEFRHAYQDLKGILKQAYTAMNRLSLSQEEQQSYIIEHIEEPTVQFERFVAEKLGEPFRISYLDVKGKKRVASSIEFFKRNK
jgi:hypothetical protein